MYFEPDADDLLHSQVEHRLNVTLLEDRAEALRAILLERRKCER